MKRDEDGEWLRIEPRPDLALDDEAPPPPRRRPRPAPGKVTRTLSLPAASPAAKASSAAPQEAAEPAPATHSDPFPDVFGGALSPQAAPAPATPAAAAHGDGDLAAAKAAVDRAFAAQRDAILAAAAEQGPALQQAAAAAHSQMISDIAARESTVRGTFAQARAAIRNAANTQIALAHSDAATVARRLRTASAVHKAYERAAAVEADRVTSTIHMDGALITGSANSVYTKLDTARGAALRSAHLELRGGDGEAANESLDASRATIRKQVQDAVTHDWRDLLKAGLDSAKALRKSADKIASDASASHGDAGDDITSAGDMLASAISQGSEQYIEALASAERDLLMSLARLRNQSSSIIQAGQIAGMRLKQDAAAKVGALGGPQTAAHRALDTVAPAGAEGIAEMRAYAVSAAADAGHDVIKALRSAPTALSFVVGERRAMINAYIDQKIAALTTEVGPAATHFTSECSVHRGQAVQEYSAAETQLVTQAMSQVGAASSIWRAEADRFIANAGQLTSAVLQAHREFESRLDDSFVGIARDAVAKNQRTSWQRGRDSALEGITGIGRGTLSFAKGAAKFAAIVIAAPLIPLGTIAASAYVVYGIVKGAEHRVDTLRASWNKRGTLGKALGVVETGAAIWGDQTGVTSMVEGVLHHEAISHRALSNGEAGAKYAEGALNLVAAAILERSAGAPHPELSAGESHMPLPAGRVHERQVPAADPPPNALPAGAQPPKQLPPAREVAAPEIPPAAAAKPTIPSDPFAALVDRGLKPETIEVLRETRVDPARVESLLDHGGVAKEIALDAIDHGPEGIAALDELAQQRIPPRVGRDVLRLSQEMGIRDQIIELIRSGNLENPAKLRGFLKEVAGELSQGSTGKYTQLNEAMLRAREGHRVDIEGRRRVPNDKSSGQADVIDHTESEALQMKVVQSSSVGAVISNAQKAVDQLGGVSGEVPPEGYRLQADIRIINDANPLYMADRAALIDALRGNLENLEFLEPTDAPAGSIVVTNGNHQGPFVISPKELR